LQHRVVRPKALPLAAQCFEAIDNRLKRVEPFLVHEGDEASGNAVVREALGETLPGDLRGRAGIRIEDGLERGRSNARVGNRTAEILQCFQSRRSQG
jgi:hypothetical protein